MIWYQTWKQIMRRILDIEFALKSYLWSPTHIVWEDSKYKTNI